MNILLKKLSSLRNINKPADYNYIKPIKTGTNIPKICHQTYFTKSLPSDIEKNINQLKSMNPDWEFRLYDDKDIEAYIQQHYPNILQYYKKINPIYGAAKADFFRYLLTYNEGGVYLDIKSSAEKPFDEIIHKDDSFLLSYWPNEKGSPFEENGISRAIPDPLGEFQQWHIISVKGHPFLKAVIENVCHNIDTYNPFIHHIARWGVFTVTGPVAYSLAIASVLNKHPHRLVRSHYDLNLIYSIYSTTRILKHLGLFKKHYSNGKEPIIIQPFLINLVLKLYLPIREGLIESQWINKLREARFF